MAHGPSRVGAVFLADKNEAFGSSEGEGGGAHVLGSDPVLVVRVEGRHHAESDGDKDVEHLRARTSSPVSTSKPQLFSPASQRWHTAEALSPSKSADNVTLSSQHLNADRVRGVALHPLVRALSHAPSSRRFLCPCGLARGGVD
eukprot:3933394-Rhodomonas_salina.3